MTTLHIWILVGAIFLSKALNEEIAFFFGAIILIVCTIVSVFS